MGQAVGALISIFLFFCMCGSIIEETSLPVCPVDDYSSPTSYNQLLTMNITMVATLNLYADMVQPFTVTALIEDSVTDAQISDASVIIMAEYLGGDNPEWTSNYTAPEEMYGFYTVQIAHTGAGYYWFTAFANATGYEDSSARILRTVQPERPGTGYSFEEYINMMLPFYLGAFLGVFIILFIAAPLFVHLVLKRKS